MFDQYPSLQASAPELLAYLLWVVAGLAFVQLCRVLRQHFEQRERRRIMAKPPLTGNEREFLGRLRRALEPDFEVWPQVAMGALVTTGFREDDPEYRATRQLFAEKVCDYVVRLPGGEGVVAVIELDDRTHDGKRGKDRDRDALLRRAGIPTVRFDSRAKPTEAVIRSRIEQLVEA